MTPGVIKDCVSIARAEFIMGLRNRWIVLATAMLLVFSGVLALVGGAPGGASHIGRLPATLANLVVLSVYLTPLLALMLSFDAIAGEIDRSSLPMLLATPVSRASVIIGKALGHIVVLAIALATGFGLAGAGLYLAEPAAGGLADLIQLIVTSIMLGAVFLGFGYAASSLARSAQNAAASAIGVWLILVVLFDLALLGALVADKGGAFSQSVFPWLLIANPADAFRVYNLAHIGADAAGLGGVGSALPFSADLALVALGAWIVGALAIAITLFKRVRP